MSNTKLIIVNDGKVTRYDESMPTDIPNALYIIDDEVILMYDDSLYIFDLDDGITVNYNKNNLLDTFISEYLRCVICDTGISLDDASLVKLWRDMMQLIELNHHCDEAMSTIMKCNIKSANK